MIGKIISDRFGLTELLGGEVAQVYEPIVQLRVNDDEWKTLINEIKAANRDTVKIKLAIDKAGLSDVDGLNDYIINQVNNGKNIDNESVNSLIQSQNYQNIADAAHGYKGVKQAIDAYNESLQKNDDNITIATNNTNKFIDTLSKTNPQLAGCMRNAEGSTISFSNYAGSLIKTKIQTIGLQTATTAMNAAISFGVSFVISGLVSLIQYAVSANKRFIEAQQNIIDSSNDIIQKNEEEITSLEELQTALKEAGTNKQELAKISEDLNKTIGHTEGLLNGETEAWNKANLKLKDRIELLKEQNKAEVDKKIQAQENIYSNNVISNANGFDVSLDKVRSREINFRPVTGKTGASFDLFSYLGTLDISEDTADEIMEYLSGGTTTVGELFDYIRKKAPDADASTLYDLITHAADYGYYIDADEFQEYFNSQTQSAQELMADFIKSSTGIFDKSSLNNMIGNFVESGFSLSEIENAIDRIANNQELEDAIDKFYDSLLDPEADSESYG